MQMLAIVLIMASEAPVILTYPAKEIKRASL